MADNGGSIPDFGGMGGENGLPSAEQLLQAIEKMQLSEADKQKLKESILDGSLSKKAGNIAAEAAQQAAKSEPGDFVVLLILISLVFLVLVFFGYKLYSSLMEKERRREEKKRQKQQKKKK